MARLPSTSPLLLFFEKGTWSHMDLEWTKETEESAANKVQCLWWCLSFQSQLKSEFWEKHLKRWKRLSKEGCIISPSWLLYELQTLYVHHAAVLGAKQKNMGELLRSLSVSLIVWVYLWTQGCFWHTSVNSWRLKAHWAADVSGKRRVTVK